MDGHRMSGEEFWCVIVRADNYHDHEVWGPYSKQDADEVFERLVDRGDIRGPVGKVTLEPMSRDWDVENEAIE